MRIRRRRDTIELPVGLLMALLQHERRDGTRDATVQLEQRLVAAVEAYLRDVPTALGAMRLVGEAHADLRRALAELALREDPDLLVAAAAEVAAAQLLQDPERETRR